MAQVPPRIPGRSPGELWIAIEDTVRQVVGDMLQRLGLDSRSPRMLTINIPIAGPFTPTAGWLTSVGIAGFNARIVGYQIFSLVPGAIILDIRKSTPSSHPGMTSMPVLRSQFPSLNGTYTENLDTSGWTTREVLDGEMLHIYAISAVSIQQATLVLRLQDLDEKA